jgi:glycosyltransferase involved in cell wall biosynthesis
MRGGGRRVLESVGLVPPVLRYPAWIRERLATRLIEYPLSEPAVSFSIITPVCDPSPRHLRALARSVLDQDYPTYEWVIVDNGCRRWRVRRLLRSLARHPRVRLAPLPNNTGIVAGSRAALLAATGDYVLPVDHDDTIYPDALRVMAHFIHAYDQPAILYSDEDKLIRGQPACPFFKPDWDPALLLNCCYVTHLTAYARGPALELEAYTDPTAEGCPDWDTYCRFVRAGQEPLHVPEVLYSWRVHRRSTSSIEAGAKDYAVRSQQRVLENHLEAAARPGPMKLQENPLFGHAGMWRIARSRGSEPALQVNLVTRGELELIRKRLVHLAETAYPRLQVRVVGPLSPICQQALEADFGSCFESFESSRWRGRYAGWLKDTVGDADPDSLIVTLRDDYSPLAPDWPWELVGLLERHEDAAAACGQFLDHDGKLQQAGEVFGYLGLAGSPIVGPHFPPSGYHGLLFCQRTVSVPTPYCFIARAGFLAEALARVERPPSWEMLGLWLGAHARRGGRRVLYTPHVACQQESDAAWPRGRSDEEVLAFLRAHADVLEADPFYGRFLSLSPGEGYLLTWPGRRRAMLKATLSRLELPQPSCRIASNRFEPPAPQAVAHPRVHEVPAEVEA